MKLLEQLKKNSNFWIRFELGIIHLKGKEYFDEMQYRAMTILNSIFDENDDILFVVCISKSIDCNEIDRPHIKRFKRKTKRCIS
ncbi:hypothetical protein FG382_22070 [Psychrobacillus lasiicapitis]|uniref:DUF3885 domain-containing protein n=2 Tax=Psychrobacillus lasiicapitis TaxID=1636719 RepID=A0A544SRH5_9BACI|nr:hypothetical protein FG382_22070 [Psychrobacillus lasiicapitis]GGA48810.1 hypothetical protein GCM10011384_43130 [Psychrobacillus lasiicapitis]